MRPLPLVAAAATVWFSVTSAGAEIEAALPETTVRASLKLAAREIEGSAEVRWRNSGPGPARILRLLLFANRFRTIDNLNALERHMLIADDEFGPGGTDVVAVREGEEKRSSRLESPPGFFPDTVLAVDLGRDVPRGEEIRVSIDFRTRLPNLFDVFGASRDLAVADGGWHPLPLSFDAAASVATPCA
ncbi:MAG: hypothetical protein ACREQQ_14140, partial [Candidatus Binatia bacterium]